MHHPTSSNTTTTTTTTTTNKTTTATTTSTTITGGGVVCVVNVWVDTGVIAFTFGYRDRAVEYVPGLDVRFVAGAVEGSVVDSRSELCWGVARSLGTQPGPFVG